MWAGSLVCVMCGSSSAATEGKETCDESQLYMLTCAQCDTGAPHVEQDGECGTDGWVLCLVCKHSWKDN